MTPEQLISDQIDRKSAEAYLKGLLQRQRDAFLRDGIPSVDHRIDQLKRCLAILADNHKALVEAVSEDFGHRSYEEILMVDLMSSHSILKESVDHVREWVQEDNRRSGNDRHRAFVRYQPLGVVGVISPWNFPTNLTFTPLSGILAAGNRAIIKQTEYTPATTELMMALFRAEFDESEIAITTGGPMVGEIFSRLPFDHLMFTGTAAIAKHVMRGAAENLVPVTLELGGKSPVILGNSVDVALSASKIMGYKVMNVGQICVAPDYAFVPWGHVDAFVAAATESVKDMFPTLLDNPDYSSVINRRHYERLTGYLDDARAKGAQVLEINPANEDFGQQAHFKLPPALVLDVTDDMALMQHEVFGPILPIKCYESVQEVIDYVNAHERPLALYYLGDDRAEEENVLQHTISGGVTVNDLLTNTGTPDLPFGGVGASGMGCYHGVHGFRNFSHARAIYRKESLKPGGANPPYGQDLRPYLEQTLRG